MSATPSDDGRPTNGRRLKVRTGCVTCKIRKVKCDEAKPFCKRCLDTGRKCDGYVVPERRPHKSDADRSVISWAQPRIRNVTDHQGLRKLAPAGPNIDTAFLSHLLSGEERQWIEFFSLRTGPALSSVFSHSFWSHTLPQLSTSDPAIRHALLALGSAHAKFEAEAVDNQVVASAVRPGYVLRNYNEAIKHLQLHLNREGASADVPLLCCLLFICLECLYNNRTLMLEHLRNGLNILRSLQARSAKSGQSSNPVTPSIQLQVRPLFHRLDAQSTLFGESASPMFGDMEAIAHLVMPTRFKDFEHAKVSLDALVGSTLVFVRTINDEAYTNGTCQRSTRVLQQYLQQQFNIWSASMVDLVARCKPFTTADNRREKSLRVQHTAAFVWLTDCTEIEEISSDAYKHHYANIVQWSHELTTPAEDTYKDPSIAARMASLTIEGLPKFTLSVAYIPPLYLVAIKCRDPVIRREAITVLQTTKGREGLWDARAHAKVARRVVEIEESSTLIYSGAKQAYMDPGPSMQMIVDGEPKMLTVHIPEGLRVRDTQIRNRTEGPNPSCDVTFSTAPNGLLEDWMTWTESFQF